ncbi:hypothetical protein [Helicobacter japonicus]|nr:hypothetical protein [Helicobacter japonicus]
MRDLHIAQILRGGGGYNVASYAPLLFNLNLKRERQFAFIAVRAA